MQVILQNAFEASVHLSDIQLQNDRIKTTTLHYYAQGFPTTTY